MAKNSAKRKKEKKKEKKKKTSVAKVESLSRGERVSVSQKKSKGSFIGRKFVKKAGQWLNYECFNRENVTDKFIWE